MGYTVNWKTAEQMDADIEHAKKIGIQSKFIEAMKRQRAFTLLIENDEELAELMAEAERKHYHVTKGDNPCADYIQRGLQRIDARAILPSHFGKRALACF